LRETGSASTSHRRKQQQLPSSQKRRAKCLSQESQRFLIVAEEFEDAIQQGIAGATKTLEKVRGAWVSEQTVKVENDKISEY
jgi:Dodecin